MLRNSLITIMLMIFGTICVSQDLTKKRPVVITSINISSMQDSIARALIERILKHPENIDTIKIVKTKYVSSLGETQDPAPGVFRILLNERFMNTLGMYFFYEVLIHELVHVDQYSRGDLYFLGCENDMCDYYVWKGETYDMGDYDQRRYERHAFKKTKKLLKKLYLKQ